MRIIIAVLCVILLTGCTVVRYKDGDKSLTIGDLRISGSAIDLDAVLTGKGRVSVNRKQGSTADVVDAVGDIIDGPLL